MDLTFQIARDQTLSLTAKVNTVVLDLTGATIFFVLKLTQSIAADPIISKSIASGITVPTPSNGQFTVALTAADMELLSDLTSYFWEILIVKAGKAIAADGFEGAVTVLPSLMDNPG